MTFHLKTSKKIKFTLVCALSLSLLGAAATTTNASTHKKTASSAARVAEDIKPVAASYGYFINEYTKNVKANNTPATNPATALFDKTFLKYWSPANGGTKLNKTVLGENINKSIQITNHRSKAETVRSFLTDRRDLRYNLISGLGPYQAAFVKNADAQTDFHKYPSKPLPGSSPYSSMKWASESSNLGKLVSLVDLAEGSDWSGSGTPKAYIQYTRPYRQSKQVSVNPALKYVMAAAPKNDYDFPSGHTTAAFETGLTLGYALPQRFQQLITRSSEVGYDRVLAGRHSALAVMGGRILGTAITGGVLNDPANQSLIAQAYKEGQSKYLAKSSLKRRDDTFANSQKNKKN